MINALLGAGEAANPQLAMFPKKSLAQSRNLIDCCFFVTAVLLVDPVKKE